MIQKGVVGNKPIDLARDNLVPNLLGLALGLEHVLDRVLGCLHDLRGQLQSADELRNGLQGLAKTGQVFVLGLDPCGHRLGFGGDKSWIEFREIQNRWLHRSGVHGHASEELVGPCLATILERKQNADLAAGMDVARKLVTTEPVELRDDELLADLAGLLDELLGNAHAIDLQSVQLLDALDVVVQSQLAKPGGQRSKAFVLGDKVGLATERQNNTSGLGVVQSRDNTTFVGVPIGDLIGNLAALFAKVLKSPFVVATGLLKRLLAIHQTSPGLLAELGYVTCGNIRH